MDADGWIPTPGFGQIAEPDRQHDLVANVFVLNVLPDPCQRIRALQHAAGFVRPDGNLFVITGPPADIDPRAGSANWPAHHVGYWSSEAKGTFQKGLPTEEIVALARRAGLWPAGEQALLAGSPAGRSGAAGQARIGSAAERRCVARPHDPAGEPTPLERLGYA